MTERLPFTQAGLRRAIAAAQKEGLRVTGIRPDGTIIVDYDDAPVAPPPGRAHDDAVLRKWGDDE